MPKEYRFNTAITYGTLVESAERGGQTYKTVTIGVGENKQTWMAENLNYYDETLDGQSWCFGSKNSETTEKCAVTGRFYTWSAAIGKSQCGYGALCMFDGSRIQGICPDGWHLPTIGEWKVLFSNVGGQDNAANVLKSKTGWRLKFNGADSFGFSALPAGVNRSYNLGLQASFWSSTQIGAQSSYGIYLYLDEVVISDYDKYYGQSVRCVKD